MSTIHFQINCEITIGCRGGYLRWTVHTAMLICKVLLNWTPPSTIPDNIQTMSAAFTGSEVNEITLLDYVRKCCVFVQNLNSMLAACNLGKAENYHQIFTDSTTRRQITFHNLLIGLMTDGDFESVIFSSCIWLKNEISEKQVEAVKNKVQRWMISLFVLLPSWVLIITINFSTGNENKTYVSIMA